MLIGPTDGAFAAAHFERDFAMRRRTALTVACLCCLLLVPTAALAARTLKWSTAHAYALKDAHKMYLSLISDGATGYSVDSCRRLTKSAFSCTEVFDVDNGDITCVSRVIVAYRGAKAKKPRVTYVPDS